MIFLKETILREKKCKIDVLICEPKAVSGSLCIHFEEKHTCKNLPLQSN